MTAWVVLFAVTVLFALALRRGRPKDPPLLTGYNDTERQLAELRALTAAGMNGRPDRPPARVVCAWVGMSAP
jgi:hypothetical protein